MLPYGHVMLERQSTLKPHGALSRAPTSEMGHLRRGDVCATSALPQSRHACALTHRGAKRRSQRGPPRPPGNIATSVSAKFAARLGSCDFRDDFDLWQSETTLIGAYRDSDWGVTGSERSSRRRRLNGHV